MNDTMRGALDSLVPDGPEQPGRLEAVWARHHRTRQRRQAGVVVTVLAVLTLRTLAAGEPVTGRVDLVDRLVPRTEHSGRPGVTLPAVRPSAPVPGTPSPAPATPSLPVPPPRPGQSVRPPAARPAGVFALAEQGHARRGEKVAVTAFPYAANHGLESVTVAWGDGTAETFRIGYCAGRDRRTGRRHVGFDQQRTYKHAYAANGRYAVEVTARFGGCGLPAATGTAVTEVRIDDEPFDELNGPGSVNIRGRAVEANDGKAGRSRIRIDAIDGDGVIGFALVDWGDGSTTLLRGRLPDDCPAARGALDRAWPAYVEHTFDSDGDFIARVAIWSMSCDGRGNQGSLISFSATRASIDPGPGPLPTG